MSSSLSNLIPAENLTNQENQAVSVQTKQNEKKQNVKPSQVFAPSSEHPSSIFAKQDMERKILNIFAKNQQGKEKANIFSQHTKSVNLFNISTVPQTNSSNIFKTANKPLIKPAEEDDEKSLSEASSNNDQKLKKVQSEFKSIPEKLEMKFHYQNPWNVLKTYNLRKFKNGLQSSKQFIYMTFQTHKQCPQKIHVIVRARETKVLLFQGFAMKDLSEKISTFMEKEQNLKFWVIKQQKRQNEEDLRPQLVREELKVQFETMDDVRDFRKFMKEYFGQKEETNTHKSS